MAFATINKGSSYFNPVLYTGTGATNARTGIGFQPDWTWIKCRNTTDWHILTDAVRGATKTIYSNSTAAETTQAQALQSFNTDGFTLGTSTEVNTNANTYVAWNWLGANTTASNTSGTITSTVSANTTSGFSIATGTFAAVSSQTVGHGLGVTPSMYIMKIRNTTENWVVYHKSLGATQAILLNSTNGASSNIGYFNNTSPTSSVVSFGSYFNSTNTFVVYSFAEIKGFSKFGSYTGNGSADGTFVYTGFKPAFLMVKRTDASGDNWFLYDNKRPSYNLTVNRLYPNLSNSEDSNADYGYDLLSNGFKVRTSNTGWNASGGTYIYAAFASNPFVTSGGIPVTAR